MTQWKENFYYADTEDVEKKMVKEKKLLRTTKNSVFSAFL